MSLVFPPSEVMRSDAGPAASLHVEGAPYVLVVDDEGTVGYFLQRTIEAAGYQVLVARSAEEAIEFVGQRAPFVAICDIRLPGASGFWLAEQVRTLAPATAVVLMTGDAQMSAAAWIRQGVIAFLVKPVNRRTLLAVLEDALRWAAEHQDRLTRDKRRYETIDVGTLRAADEPKAGDVLIERSPGAALCLFGLVRENGLRPVRLRSGTLSEARHWAEQMLSGTSGRVRELVVG